MYTTYHGLLPPCITGQGHTGVPREKKCPQVRYASHVYYAVYILYNDHYYQIIIEVAQLRQHKQRLNDLRTQLG